MSQAKYMKNFVWFYTVPVFNSHFIVGLRSDAELP